MLVANQKLDKAATTADDSERMKKVDMNENMRKPTTHKHNEMQI